MAGHTVRIGSREIIVDQSPLRTTFYRSHNPFQLNWLHDGCVEIKYHRVIRVVAWIFCILGWPVVLLGLFLPLLLLWGGPIGLMGVWLLGPRCRFDTSVGQLTIRHFWRTRRRSLTDTVAVQVIDAGQFEGSSGEGGGEIFSSYQMNLILDGPSAPRLFVAYNSDLADMGTKAQLLADFLHVPLLASAQISVKNLEEKQASLSPADGGTIRPDTALGENGRTVAPL